MRAWMLAVVLACAVPARAHDMLDGFLFGPDPTRDSHEQDAQIREAETERDWIVHSRLHPKKRVYDNLKKPERAEYRARAHELARLYWLRGAMNDPLRAFVVLEGPHIFQDSVMRDPCGQDACPCEPQKEVDESEVQIEDKAGAAFFAGTASGERLIPVSNVEHLTFQESIKYPHVGLGQQRIGFAEINEDLVRDRVHRHFKWGKYKDAEHWSKKQEDLKASMGSRKLTVRALMSRIPALQKHTEDRIENVRGERLPFSKKNDIYRAVHNSQGDDGQFDAAIDMVIEGELQAAKLARGDHGPSDRAGRNQMAGMALVIAGAATAYAETPDYRTLMKLGAVGVMGARAARR